MQYLHFSVISEFPHKTVRPFQNFFAILPPPTLYKFKTRQNFGYTCPTFFVGWGEGLACENWKKPQKCKVEDA